MFDEFNMTKRDFEELVMFGYVKSNTNLDHLFEFLNLNNKISQSDWNNMLVFEQETENEKVVILFEPHEKEQTSNECLTTYSLKIKCALNKDTHFIKNNKDTIFLFKLEDDGKCNFSISGYFSFFSDYYIYTNVGVDNYNTTIYYKNTYTYDNKILSTVSSHDIDYVNKNEIRWLINEHVYSVLTVSSIFPELLEKHSKELMDYRPYLNSESINLLDMYLI